MFRADREIRLEVTGDDGMNWADSNTAGARLYYIQRWRNVLKHTSTTFVYEDRPHYAHGWLAGPDLEDWLEERNRYRTSSTRASKDASRHGFRLLLCDRLVPPEVYSGLSPSMSMTRSSFVNVERKLNLSQATLPALCNHSGLFTVTRIYDEKSSDIKHIQILIKAPQNIQVGNYLLSINHDVKARWTTAFLCGHFIIDGHRHDQLGRPVMKYIEALTSTIDDSVCEHPLMLPIALISNHFSRAQKRIDVLEVQLGDLECDIGVTSAARSRLADPEMLATWPAKLDIKALTIDIQSISTHIYFTASVFAWTRECLRWLTELEAKLSNQLPTSYNAAEQLREGLCYRVSATESNVQFLSCMKERIQAQTNLLFSATSQKDAAVAREQSELSLKQNEITAKGNEVNLWIATATKQDSIVMVAFTFISAVFLPGTYVSSLFSMSMFDWQYNSPDGANPGHLSKWFWIYWLVSVVLTLAVLVGWWYSNYRGRKNFKEELDRLRRGDENKGVYRSAKG